MKFLWISSPVIFVLILFSCRKNQQEAERLNADKAWMSLGDSITQSTFTAIRTALMKAIEDGGLENAIAYCNIAAIPITDSLSKQYGVQISRVSDRNRNPMNAASEEETRFIHVYRNKNNTIGDTLLHEDGKRIFYKPILTQAFCLSCHGTPGKELSTANLELIKQYYPDDLATGYTENEIRGLWKVVFTDHK